MSKRVMVSLAMGLATILLAGIGWQWLRDRAVLVEADRWENHTYIVMQQLEELLSDLKDVETGQRGFLITGADSYLEPYHEALARVDQTLASLRNLTEDNPGQQQRLAALEPVIRAKLAELKETIDLRSGQGFEPAREIVLTGRGQALMDQARRQVAEVQAQERQLLQERATAKQTNLQKTSRIVIIGGSLSYLLFLTAFLLLRREIAQRIGAEQELRRHRDHLEELVGDRTGQLREANENLAASNEELRATTEELQSEIEDRKKAEAAVRESEERFRAAYEQAAIGIEMLDLEGRFLRGNGWLSQILGYGEEELQQRTFAQITHPDDLPKELPILGKLLAREIPNYSFEKRYLHKDGHTVWVRVTSSLVRTSAPYRISIIEDITEQKEAREERERLLHEVSVHAAQLREANENLAAVNEELAASNEELRATTEELRCEIEDREKAEQALRESHARLKRVLEVETVGVMFWDLTTGRMTDANDTFLRMMGYSRREVEAGELTWQTLTPPEYLEVSLAEIRKFQATGRVGPYEKEYFRKDGTRRWLLFAGSSLGGNACVEFCVDIADRKKAEAAVRQSEEKFATAFAANTAAITLTRVEDGRFIDVNDTWVALTGYRREEAVGQSAPALAIWLTPEARVRFAQELRAKGAVRGWEQEFRKKSGELFVAQLSAQILNLQDEEVVLSTLVDITGRVRAQEALRESEERFRVAQELSPDGFLIFRPLRDNTGVVTDFLWIYENDAAARMNDTNPKEVRGKRVSEVLPHHNESPFGKVYKEVAETGEVRVLEEAVYDQDTFRQRRWFRAAAVPTAGGDVAILVQDVTERKQAEEELQRQRQIFETTVNEITTGVGLYRGEDFVVVLANPAYLALARGRDVVGRPYREVWPEAYARVAPLLQRVLATGEPYQAADDSFSLRRADGQFETRYFTWSLLRVRLPGEEGWGILNSAVETTTRVRAEAALRELNATLEGRVAERTAELAYRARQLQKLTLELTQAEEQERRRIAVILHEDLQQQIAGAKFHLSLLRHRAKDDRVRADIDQVDAMLRETVEKSRRLSHDLSPAVMHMNDLAEVLRWLVHRVQTQQGLRVHLAVSGDMMLQSEALGAFLFRSAQEMLLNVIKHAHVREAAIRVRKIGRCVCLSVSDQGRGFDPRELRETPGVGLFSIRERTELLGGRMKIKAAPGKGSRLTIAVPDDPKPEDRRQRTDNRGQTTENGQQRTDDRGQRAQDRQQRRSPSSVLRVLLVDDHDIVRQGLAALLQEAPGIELVGEAPDGREAINRALELEPEVVIMDVSMPLLSGDQATRQIKRHLPKTRVIALSMYDDADKKQSMFDAGAESYILKTVSADDLIAAIRGRSADGN